MLFFQGHFLKKKSPHMSPGRGAYGRGRRPRPWAQARPGPGPARAPARARPRPDPGPGKAHGQAWDPDWQHPDWNPDWTLQSRSRVVACSRSQTAIRCPVSQIIRLGSAMAAQWLLHASQALGEPRDGLGEAHCILSWHDVLGVAWPDSHVKHWQLASA